jgi:ATP-dependent protease Clp ATPase subunit
MFKLFHSAKAPKQHTPCCSFCQKTYLDAGPLVEGHGDTYICRDCIRLCGEMMDREIMRQESAIKN